MHFPSKSIWSSFVASWIVLWFSDEHKLVFSFSDVDQNSSWQPQSLGRWKWWCRWGFSSSLRGSLLRGQTSPSRQAPSTWTTKHHIADLWEMSKNFYLVKYFWQIVKMWKTSCAPVLSSLPRSQAFSLYHHQWWRPAEIQYLFHPLEFLYILFMWYILTFQHLMCLYLNLFWPSTHQHSS